MTTPTKARAVRFLHETASASDPLDEALVLDFLRWLGVPDTTTNRDGARQSLSAFLHETASAPPPRRFAVHAFDTLDTTHGLSVEEAAARLDVEPGLLLRALARWGRADTEAAVAWRYRSRDEFVPTGDAGDRLIPCSVRGRGDDWD